MIPKLSTPSVMAMQQSSSRSCHACAHVWHGLVRFLEWLFVMALVAASAAAIDNVVADSIAVERMATATACAPAPVPRKPMPVSPARALR